MSSETKKSNNWLEEILIPLHSIKKQLYLLSFVINLLALAVPIFVLQVYDRVVFHNGLTTLQGLAIGIAIVLVFDFIMRRARTRILQHHGVKINDLLGKQLFDKLLSLPLRTLESQRHSFWQLLFRDIELLRGHFSGPWAVLMLDLPFTVLALALIVTIATPIAWVLLLAIPLFLIIAWRSGKVIQQQSEQERRETIERDALLSEFTLARNSIKTQILDEHFANEWGEKQQVLNQTTLVRSNSSDKYRDLGQSMTMLVTVALTTVGAIAILNQELTLGGLIASNMLSSKIISPLTQLVAQWHGFTNYKDAKKRLTELFANSDELLVSSVKPINSSGMVSFRDLSFSYQLDHDDTVQDDLVLNNVSGLIESTGIHTIIGANGSGKSTLLKLLIGLYQPNSGKVMLDGADINQYSRHDLGQWIGYLPQRTTTFAASIRDNITFGYPDATDEEVVAAAKLTNAYDFVSKLKDGFATNMGETGNRFSSGECKRIALASLLIKDQKIILLDEPTSDLDLETERKIAVTLQKLSVDKTIVLVTHSPALLRISDQIMVIKDGLISAAGDSKEILPKLGLSL